MAVISLLRRTQGYDIIDYSLMEVLVENPVAARYLSELGIQLVMGSFQPCAEIIYQQRRILLCFLVIRELLSRDVECGLLYIPLGP